MQEKLARLHFGLDVCVEELPEEQKKAAADRNLDQLLAHVSVVSPLPPPSQPWLPQPGSPPAPASPLPAPQPLPLPPAAGGAQQLHVSWARRGVGAVMAAVMVVVMAAVMAVAVTVVAAVMAGGTRHIPTALSLDPRSDRSCTWQRPPTPRTRRLDPMPGPARRGWLPPGDPTGAPHRGHPPQWKGRWRRHRSRGTAGPVGPCEANTPSPPLPPSNSSPRRHFGGTPRAG